MTYKEVIEQLKTHSLCDSTGFSDERDIKAVEMAIEALEKQIPMKVRITTSTKRCGRCNRQLSGIGNMHPKRMYCTGCGQAIDWSVEE